MKTVIYKDEDIQAYVDGMLGPDETRRLAKILKINPEARQRYLTLLRQRALLQMWWGKWVN